MKQPDEAFLLYMVYDEAIHGPVTDGEGCTASRQECIDKQGWYWALREIPQGNCRYSRQLPLPDDRTHPCSHCTKGRQVLMEINPPPKWMTFPRLTKPLEPGEAPTTYLKWYHWRKANGFCVKCGKVNDAETVMCSTCNQKRRDLENAINARNRKLVKHVSIARG